MADIHPTAIVEDGADLAPTVSVGPYSIIGGNVRIGENGVIHSHVVVSGDTTIGEDCAIFPFASVGMQPQDRKFQGETSRLTIGARCTIREHVTINPGTGGGGGLTSIGDDCLLLVGAHVAHDCRLGDNIILVNQATIGGHCVLGDHVIVGGLSALHQFVRLGDHSFVGGMSGVENDVIPFGSVIGNRASLGGLNIVGMTRRGFSREAIHNLRRAYRALFAPGATLRERLAEVEGEFGDDPNVAKITAFIREGGDRALVTPRKRDR